MSNVQQVETAGNAEMDLAAKRRESAIKAATTRWKNRTVTPEEQDLGRDMTLKEAKALTPEQKKIRNNLRKAKWWRQRYHAEKNGTARPSTVTTKPHSTTAVVKVNHEHVPEQFQHLFTDDEMHQMRPMSLDEIKALPRPEYKKRCALKARLFYQMNKDKVRTNQKAYVKRKMAARLEVATQPVTQITQPTPPMAMPIKLDHCPFCMARFWGVKGKEVVE